MGPIWTIVLGSPLISLITSYSGFFGNCRIKESPILVLKKKKKSELKAYVSGFFENFQNKIASNSGFLKSFKEMTCFMKEPSTNSKGTFHKLNNFLF